MLRQLFAYGLLRQSLHGWVKREDRLVSGRRGHGSRSGLHRIWRDWKRLRQGPGHSMPIGHVLYEAEIREQFYETANSDALMCFPTHYERSRPILQG